MYESELVCIRAYTFYFIVFSFNFLKATTLINVGRLLQMLAAFSNFGNTRFPDKIKQKTVDSHCFIVSCRRACSEDTKYYDTVPEKEDF